MEKKKYRSAVRYHGLIREAYLSLLREKPDGKISVTDVVNRAGINRSTFYSHYPDINGITEEFELEYAQRMMAVLANFDYAQFLEDPVVVLKALNECIRQDEEIYRLLYRVRDMNPYLERLKNKILDFVLNHPSVPEQLSNSKTFRLRLFYFIGGITNCYQQWLMGQLDCSLDDIAEELGHITKPVSIEKS